MLYFRVVDQIYMLLALLTMSLAAYHLGNKRTVFMESGSRISFLRVGQGQFEAGSAIDFGRRDGATLKI